MVDPNAMDIDLSTPQVAGETSASGIENSESHNSVTSLSQAVVGLDIVTSTPLESTQPPIASQVANSSHSNGPTGSSSTHDGVLFIIQNDDDTELQPDRQPQPQSRITRTGYVYNTDMMLHCSDGYLPTPDDVDVANVHPEEPMRIKRIFTRLKDQGLIARMKHIKEKEVTFEQVELVHGPDHWYKVQGIELFDDDYIKKTAQYYESLSLYVCRATARCARLSCGGVVKACEAVCTNEVRNAFAIVRPPGHHAEPDEHMGFCFYNNVAVGAREMQRKGLAKKVLILDWDVHHGNGTQRVFWEDDSVLYISIHRHGGGFYPDGDFGGLDKVGEGPGKGRSVNIPFPGGGFGDGDYIYAFQRIVMPIAYEFNPDFVIISSGFDAAAGDPVGGFEVTPACYAHMTHMLCALAGGKVVVALEGGYNLKSISDSALAVAQVLLGETPAELGDVQASEVATEVISEVAKVQSKYWKSIRPIGLEPPEVGSRETEYVYGLPDLVKAYRTKHVYDKYDLVPLPLAIPDLDERYHNQVLVNDKVFDFKNSATLVVFVHDFGNLRVETVGPASVDVNATSSYLIDTSDSVLGWIQSRNYNVIDINLMRPVQTILPRHGPRIMVNNGGKLDTQLMFYIWDNIIELSNARNIVLIGHGSGCAAVMDIVNNRDVQDRVSAVVQVTGMHPIVKVRPRDEPLREWFAEHNRVYVPSIHPVVDQEWLHGQLGGQIRAADKAKVVDVLVEVLPEIQEFVETQIKAPSPPANGHVSPPEDSDA